MINLEKCDNGLTRRKSLLPQRNPTKQASTRLNPVKEKMKPKAEAMKPPPIKPDGSAIARRPSIKSASMLPSPRLGRSSSVQDSTKGPSLRRPSAGRPPIQDPFKTSFRASPTPAGQEARSSARLSSHDRSISHQLERSTTSRTVFSKTMVNQPSSIGTKKPALPAMQQTFMLNELVDFRPSSPSMKPASKELMQPAGISQLQMELAQLHLMHRSAHAIQRQWEQSARSCFRKQFDALSERHIELKEIANQQQQLINQLALVQWSHGKPGTQVAERVSLLSKNIADVCSLIDPQGKHSRILEVFESWFAQAFEKRDRQQLGSILEGQTLDLIEGIGDGWRAEAMVLERELTYSLRELKAFGSVEPNSSLGRVRTLYSSLVLNMVEELDVIQWIENEITIQETLWVESTIEKLALDVGNDIG